MTRGIRVDRRGGKKAFYEYDIQQFPYGEPRYEEIQFGLETANERDRSRDLKRGSQTTKCSRKVKFFWNLTRHAHPTWFSAYHSKASQGLMLMDWRISLYPSSSGSPADQ